MQIGKKYLYPSWIASPFCLLERVASVSLLEFVFGVAVFVGGMKTVLPLDEHGHDDVDVVVDADGADDAGAGGGGDFQSYLGLVDDA